MKHISLFSGIGGFDLASEWMGWENVAHCEWNPFGQKILKYYWPNAISYEDITKTDFSVHRGKIDILTGGFPCQPYSVAGKRKGKEDERHLWPEMLRAIREIQPSWVVGENVRGLVNWDGGLVFEEVQADLESQGYKILPFLLPASGVGAPHQRERIWFVAYSESSRSRGLYIGEKQKQPLNEVFSSTGIITNAKREGLEGYNERTRCAFNRQNERIFVRAENQFDVDDTNCRRQSSKEHRETKPRRIAEESISDYWEDFPTQSPVCDGNDGFSAGLDGITFPKWRNESIKAGGNAIVPQVAYQIFKAIQEYENLQQYA